MTEWLVDFFGNPYVIMVLLTFAPFLELRASIPYGIWKFGPEQWPIVFVVAVVTNILLAPIIYILLDKFLHVLLRIRVVDKFWNGVILRTQKKIHPKVERYGVWGLGVFIGVPLPGSGVYSGAFGGYVLGFSFRKFMIAAVMGVLIAAAVVTVVMLTGATTFEFFIKKT